MPGWTTLADQSRCGNPRFLLAQDIVGPKWPELSVLIHVLRRTSKGVFFVEQLADDGKQLAWSRGCVDVHLEGFWNRRYVCQDYGHVRSSIAKRSGLFSRLLLQSWVLELDVCFP